MTDIDKEMLDAFERDDSGHVLNCLARGANVNATLTGGITALHHAAFNEKPQMCRLMINAGIDVNLQDNKQFSALHWAVMFLNHEICELLISSGADLDLCNFLGETALFSAAGAADDSALCLMLLEHGANVSAANTNGQTAYDKAIENSHHACASLLQSWATSQAARLALQEIMQTTSLVKPT